MYEDILWKNSSCFLFSEKIVKDNNRDALQILLGIFLHSIYLSLPLYFY